MPESPEERKARKHAEYMARRHIVLARNKTLEYAERIKSGQRIWRAKNRKHLRAKYKEFHAKNKDRRNAYKKVFNSLNKEALSIKRKAAYAKDPEKHLAKNREWYSKPENKAARKIKDAAYVKANRPRINKRQCAYIAKRRREDIQYRITIRLRSRVWDALQPQSAKKAARTMELLGCDAAFFKGYLEAMFTPDMNWENYGTFWEVDHIWPLISFDLTIPENQKKAFHYTNCQPLSCKDNNFKWDKLPTELDRYYTDPAYRIELFKQGIHAPHQSSNTNNYSSPP